MWASRENWILFACKPLHANIVKTMRSSNFARQQPSRTGVGVPCIQGCTHTHLADLDFWMFLFGPN